MTRQQFRSCLEIVILALLLPVSPVFAAAEEKPPPSEQPAKKATPFSEFSLTSKKEPIHIGADKLEFLYKDKRIVYRGSVVATQGAATLKGDTLTVTYEEAAPEKNAVQPATSANTSDTTKGQQIKEIVAEGNVEITSENRRATSKKAVFNEAKRTVVLSGNAVLRDDTNQVSGETVTVYIDEDRVVVESGPAGQVEMDLIPQRQTKNEKKATKPGE